MNRQRVMVTGGSGKLGRAVVEHLVSHGGYDVLVVDRVRPREPRCPSIVADLADFGQVMDVFAGGWTGPGAMRFTGGAAAARPDAVVHLAAIPGAGVESGVETFRNNTLGDYHVFEAARVLGVKHVVYASSETVLGLPFDEPPPYVPVDEACPPRPETAYSLSKHLAETMAEQFCRWDPTLKMIGLRFSNVMEPADYARFESFPDDAWKRKWNAWGYIDARDGAQAVRKALESTLTGAHAYVIANAETVMRRSNEALLDEVFPGVERRAMNGPNATLLSIERAKRELGFEPAYGWKAEGR